MKKSYKGTESNGTDTVVYLELVTSEGIKTVETEETSNTFSKGMIVSFTGTYEKANDDIKVESDSKYFTNQTSTSAVSQGYVAISNNWSDSSKLIRPYAGLFNGDKSVDVASAKVVSDSTVIYIDEDGYVVDEGTPSKAEELANANGYYANAFVIVNSDNEIDLLVYETGNRIKDGSNKEVQLLTQAGKDAKDANAKIQAAVDALNKNKAISINGAALTEAATNESVTSAAVLNGTGVTYTIKSIDNDKITAAIDNKAIKLTEKGVNLKVGDTVKVVVTVSATNGTAQDVELTLTIVNS